MLSPALERINQEVDAHLGRDKSVSPFAYRRPRIGVSVNVTELGSCVAGAYTDAIIQAGATPLVLPITEDIETLYSSLLDLDALLLTGGSDIHPRLMGEEPLPGLGSVSVERDRYELRLIRLARRLSLPILGICRGHQILGVAYGSILYQDIISQHKHDHILDHSPALPKGEAHHKLLPTSYEGNRLVDILGLEPDDDVWVNSLHHQALREVFPPFYETAKASDDINEAIDAYPELDILAVQWHPEQMVASGSTRQMRLFTHLVERARLYHRARAFHNENIVLDSHTDTPMFFSEDFDIKDSDKTRVDLTKMCLGGVHASVMVAYLPQGEVTDEAHKEAKAYAIDKLQELHRQVSEYPYMAMICRTPDDVIKAQLLGRKAIVPAIENGYAIGEDLANLSYYQDTYGLAYITLCHNGDNALCDSARKSERTHGGLSQLGIECIEEMNRLGIMIDVSHAGEETISDVLRYSTKPIIASHSSARQLCDHARNLSDEQIQAIAERGGVVQVCLYAGFINEDEKQASYLDAVDHIEHIVQLVGIEHVGIGSDFDGDGELIGCRTSEDLIRITIELLRRGYDEDDLELIWGGNFLRVWDANLA